MVHTVYQQFPELDYTLIKRTSSFQPWVLCYMYDFKTGTWAQGHYFSTLYQVEAYLNAHSEKYYNDRYSYKVNEFEAIYFDDDPEPYEEYYYPLIDTFHN